MVESLEESFCVSEDTEGFFVAEGVLEAEGFFVAAGALDAAGVREAAGLLEEAGVPEAVGVSDAASFLGMVSPCCRIFLHALQMVSPVYPSLVVVAAFLFTTSFSKW